MTKLTDSSNGLEQSKELNLEVKHSIRNIVADTRILLQRRDKLTNEKLISLWMDFGEKLQSLNDETKKLLDENKKLFGWIK